MALIRCPKHDIPYNEDNPRGCPACANGIDDGAAGVMQELARASKEQQRPTLPPAAPAPVRQSDPQRQETLNELFAGTAATIREEARPIETTGTRIRGLFDRIGQRKTLKLGIPLVIILAAVVSYGSTNEFVPHLNPAPVASPLPLPIEPGTPVEIVFSILGVRDPAPHPSDTRLARFVYGTDLIVDGLNNSVYDVIIRVANRTWNGVTVGLSEELVRGALARMGEPEEIGNPSSAQPTQVGKYLAYETLEARPLRRLRAAVRPPNGCYDVIVDLRPQSTGVISRGSERWIVVGVSGTQPPWVSTRVMVVDRGVMASDGSPPGC